jgi:predicted RNase H-like HicB family nuclease
MNLTQTMSKMLKRDLSTDEARRLSDEQFGMLAAYLREQYAPKFLAVVPTAYEIYAVGTTEAEAKKLALEAALEWLVMGEAEMERGIPYVNVKEVEEYLGCNVYPISEFGVAQEG